MANPTTHNPGFELDPGEQVLRIIRRHPFDALPTIFTSIILVLAALGLAYISGRYPNFTPFPPFVYLPLVITLLVLAAIIFLIGIFVFQNNYLVFTNLHYVQVEQIGLFGHRVSQLSFLRVEDVTGKKTGVLQTIFNYGDVTVQTAAEEEKFVFHNAPNPTEVADDALQTHERCQHEANRHGASPTGP